MQLPITALQHQYSIHKPHLPNLPTNQLQGRSTAWSLYKNGHISVFSVASINLLLNQLNIYWNRLFNQLMFEPHRHIKLLFHRARIQLKRTRHKVFGPPKVDKHSALLAFVMPRKCVYARRSHFILRNSLTKETAAKTVTSPQNETLVRHIRIIFGRHRDSPH